MSFHGTSPRLRLRPSALPSRPSLQILKLKPRPASTTALAARFWTAGLALAAGQAWVFRFRATPDSIAYVDMSDAVLPGGDWHRLINGTWSPLYPFLIGLARRWFSISPANEIVGAHLLSIGIFIFAFGCFEFLLRSATGRVGIDPESAVKPGALVPVPLWLCRSLAYSIFLWATISEISLRNLRPDLLMSGFVYLAVGTLVRMQGSPGRWKSYLALGAVLGVGFLAKAPMLPIGIVILVVTLFVVERWRPALKMAAAALAVMMAIASLYFVPLSRARGHFTLGESGAFNYLVHVDLAKPSWYLQDPGRGSGSFAHPAQRIFSSPPAYAFALPDSGTHPLKFDPSDWMEGVRPRFVLRRQVATLLSNSLHDRELLFPLGVAVCGVLVLSLSRRRENIFAFRNTWPLFVIGASGCLMYALVHVEPRYVAAFLVLFWCSLLFGIRLPRSVNNVALGLITLAVMACLLLPTGRNIYIRHAQGMGKVNSDALGAAELERLGVRPGDHVARISRVGSYAIERLARVTVAAEVDLDHATEFWSSPLTAQHNLLQIFARRGVKAVIATSPKLSPVNQSEWKQLGSTQYWVWMPNPPDSGLRLGRLGRQSEEPDRRKATVGARFGIW